MHEICQKVLLKITQHQHFKGFLLKTFLQRVTVYVGNEVVHFHPAVLRLRRGGADERKGRGCRAAPLRRADIL